VYKLDMAAALEHLAKTHGIPTSYVELTPDARAKRTHTANAASRKRARQEMEETDGPPDKHRDFKKGMHTSSSTQGHLWY